MFRKVLKSEIKKTIRDFTIVKSVEQVYFDDCTKCGEATTWYDVCLDGGCGDIVFSCSDMDMAIEWIEEYQNGYKRRNHAAYC